MNQDTTFVIHDKPYFTLPLAALPALHVSRDPTRLAGNLISLAIGKMAEHFKSQYTEDEVHDLECAQSGLGIEDWSEQNQNCPVEDQPHLALACLFLNVTTGRSLEAIEIEAEAAMSQIKEYNYNPAVVFSVQARDLWDLKNGNMHPKDFLVLAAIRSIIGMSPRKKPPRRITRDQIAARVLGYTRVKDIPPAQSQGWTSEASLKRIGRRAAKLARQERFTRWTGFKRETYYHVSMSESEIAEYATERKIKTANKKIAGLEAELESKTKLQELRHKEELLRESLSKLK